MTQRTWYIKQCRLFEQLSKDQLHRLEMSARIRSFSRNMTVYRPTDESETVFVLLSGRIRLCTYTPDGKQAILAFIEPGEMFGQLGLAQSENYEDHAETMLPSTVALIPKADIDRLLLENASFSLGITKFISWRMRRIERRLRSLLFRSNRDRLVQLMLDLREQYGRPTAGGILLDIRLTHQELANVIGCTRESVTMMLGELQLQRHITINRKRIVIADPNKLATELGLVPQRPRSSSPSKGWSSPSLGITQTPAWRPADSCES